MNPTPPSFAPSPQKSNTLKIVAIILGVVAVVCILFCGLLAALLLPAVSAAREAAQRQMAANNFRQIGLAIHNYHDTYKKLPSVHGINHEQLPSSSWRFIVTPFLSQENVQLYNRYSGLMNQAWSSTEPKELLNAMPPAFRSPLADKAQPANHSNYFTIQGPNTAFPKGGTWIGFRDFRNGLSNCIMAVELRNHSIPWIQPTDLTMDEAIAFIRKSPDPQKVLLLLCDGSVVDVGEKSDEELRGMMTISGNAPAVVR